MFGVGNLGVPLVRDNLGVYVGTSLFYSTLRGREVLREITRKVVILLLDRITVVIVIMLYSPCSYSGFCAVVVARGFLPI